MRNNDGLRLRARRLVWLLAVTALLALALAGCAGRVGAQYDNGSGGSNTTQQTGGNGPDQGAQAGGSNAAAQQVQDLDQQVQSISQSLDGASQDADSDYASQDNEAQPSSTP
jgi:hypothetical protein